jgi:hypothetical protein
MSRYQSIKDLLINTYSFDIVARLISKEFRFISLEEVEELQVVASRHDVSTGHTMSLVKREDTDSHHVVWSTLTHYHGQPHWTHCLYEIRDCN